MAKEAKAEPPPAAGDPSVKAADDYLATLAMRAERVLAGRPVDEAVRKVRAVVGMPRIPDAEVAAQAAWDKLRASERPTAAELAALELVIRLMRPAPLSKGGELQPLPSKAGDTTFNQETHAAWEGFRTAVKPFLYSIGRLDRASGPEPAVGTGFLVAPDLVLTNRHVVAQLSIGVEALDPGQAVITFNQEAETVDPPESRFAVAGVVALHPRLDLALLRVDLPTPRPVPRLAAERAPPGTEVAAVGYPYRDGRDPLFVPAIYGSRYGVKRAALGQVTGGAEGRVFHDCSTLGGNSGSPILSLATGEVVGVHYTGTFMYRNEAVAAADVAAFLAAAGR